MEPVPIIAPNGHQMGAMDKTLGESLDERTCSGPLGGQARLRGQPRGASGCRAISCAFIHKVLCGAVGTSQCDDASHRNEVWHRSKDGSVRGIPPARREPDDGVNLGHDQ